MQPDVRMSKKKRRALRAQTITAIGLAVLFVLSAVPALFFANLENRLFSPKTYQIALEETGAYKNLTGLLARQLHYAATYDTCMQNPMACRFPYTGAQTRACIEETLGKGLVEAVVRNERRPTPQQTRDAQACFSQFGQPPQGEAPPPALPVFFALFSPNQIEGILNNILAPAELQTFLDQAISSTLAYAGGDQKTLTVRLDWLSRRVSEQGPEAILKTWRNLPICQPDAVMRNTRALFNNQLPDDLFQCNPGDETVLLLSPFINRVLKAQAALIPKSVSLGELPAPMNANLSNPAQLIRGVMRYGWIVPLVWLIALFIVIARSWKAVLLWWGAPLAIVGVFSLGLSALGIPLMSGYIEQQITTGMPPTLTPEIASTLHALIVDIIGHALAPVTVQSIAISATGLIMLIVAQFVHK